jgi:hypothetical protein
MRSELVSRALAHISSRYQLCHLVSKGTRKFHRPKSRLQDTTNEVLVRLRHSSPISDTQIALEPAPFEQRCAA